MKYDRKSKSLDRGQFLLLFRQFIHDSQRGVRLQRNGKRIKPATIYNYEYTYKLLVKFFEQEGFELQLGFIKKTSEKELHRVDKKWKDFYVRFTNFLYKKGCHDNYVGLTVKVLRVYFNYLNNEKHIPIGNFYRKFYVPKDDIPIVVISPQQLARFIRNTELHERLPADLRVIKDIFVFGCTVGLRVSDIMSLKPFNVSKYEDHYYLRVKSKKTGTDTSIKLPAYAVDIIKRHEHRQPTLLPCMSKWYFNKRLKEMAAYISDDEPLVKVRTRKGEQVAVYKNRNKKTHYTFADHISSHTMRRTAITTMLSLGMPEHLVRKISGHAPGSKEFYKYVALSQNLQDTETDKVFEKLEALEA